MSIITIIGAGMMGSTMSRPAADNGHEVRLVGPPLDREIVDSVRRRGYHPILHGTLPAASAVSALTGLGNGSAAAVARDSSAFHDEGIAG